MTKWHEKTLGEVTAFIAKGIPPKYVETETQNTIRVLNQKCNRNYEISYVESRLHDLTARPVPESKYIRPGDVLINSTGTGTAGRVAQIFSVPSPTTIDGHMILLRPSDEIDPLYYGYCIKNYQKKIESLAEGSTGQTEINRQRLQDEIVIRFPNEKELQKTIGMFLFQIDEKIKCNKQINDNLYAQARAIKKHWVTANENGYKLLPLAEIAEINPDTYSLKEAWEYVNYLDTSNITNGFISNIQRINPSNEKLPSRARRKVITSDVLFSTVRPNQSHFGIVSDPLPNMLVSTGFAVIRSKNPLVCNELIYLCLTERDFVKKMQQLAEQSTSTYPSIKPSDLGACEIPCPKDEKSTRFLNTLESLFALIAANFQENNSLTAMRDALLPKLMSGELDVSAIEL